MNQRISVRAVIHKEGKTLLVRRSSGRATILGKYELPGGKLEYNEQPEDALRRYLRNDLNLRVKTAQLYDVLTYVDHDDRDLQYVFIIYLVTVEDAHIDPAMSDNYNHYVWSNVSKIQQYELTESTKMLLGISQRPLPSTEMSTETENTEAEYDSSHVIIYSDGGSRGNPGPSASGFIIMNQQKVLHEGGVYLGITTNNQAEYHGVRLGLEKALDMGARTIDFRLDSLLVVNQLNGIYRIKNRELWPIYERIRELVGKFEKVNFSHVKREFNQLADGMVNKILDAHERG